MQTTIEISNYPLHEDFENRILDFIRRVQKDQNVTVKINATSTHIVGEYDYVMQLVQREIKTSFEKYGKMIFVIKVLYGALDLDVDL